MKTLRGSDTLIIIPAFNEERNIGPVLDELLNKCKKADTLVVDDGSADKTSQVAAEKGVFVLSHIYNLGIGASFETGCQFALCHDYAFVVRMDGDGQHAPEFIEDVLKPVRDNEVDIAIGSRFLTRSGCKSSFVRLIGIYVIAYFLTLMTGKRVTDPTSGFCAMNRKAFEFFSQNCPADYPEPETLIYHKEFRIKEVPTTIHKRREGVSSITPFRSMYYMIKVLFSISVRIFR